MIGLILPMLVPVRSGVEAQSEMSHFSSAHAIYTSEFGIESPEGMVYSPDTKAFIIWGKNNSEDAILFNNESSIKINIPQNIGDPLGAAFDEYSNNLFILENGNTELIKTKIEDGNPPAARFDIKALRLQDVQGITFDPATGRLFILDAIRQQILILSPHPVDEFNKVNAVNNRVSHFSLESLSRSALRGVAFNPSNGHLYIGSPDERKVYELRETGEKVSTYDISGLHIENPSLMLFAPSQDATDDPNIMALYILDNGQPTKSYSDSIIDQRNTSQKGQIVELSLQAPAALPPGTNLLPGTLVHTFNTSNVAWNPSSPDPAGIDYWPVTGRLLIVDSEVDEMPIYFQGKNVFLSTTSGTLTGTCSSMSFTIEPTGVAINPNNNHIFFSTDFDDTIFEVSLGTDGIYCTSDDTVTATNVSSLYNINDAEDVAYGNNTLFIAGGSNAEVYVVPFGPNGTLGGGDDGAMTHFDTAALGFTDLEGIGYNSDRGTLFIVSTVGTERYVGETTKSGTLLRAYDLSFMGSAANLRSDVAYAPSSQNPAVKNIYIVSRGVDNDVNRNENDGKVWEVQISNLSAQVDINIDTMNVMSYNIPPGQSVSDHYNLNGGPVQVVSTDGVTPIFTSERTIYGSSFNSIVGYPGDQLTTDYWFTSYDDVGMITYLVIGNPSTSQTAQVNVYIGGVKRNPTSYSIPPGQRIFHRYGVNGGPVFVDGINGVNIFASERTKFGNSFNEIMGYPANQLTTDYWFTSYDDVGMITYLVIGNPSTSQTAQVDVYIGGVKRNPTLISIPPGQRVFHRYQVNGGPVFVDGINGVSIFASERSRFGDTFNEVMGYPANRVHTEFWFTSYDDTSMLTYLVIGNPSTGQTAQVDVYIGGVKRNPSPISIPPGQRYFQRYGINAGPVRVVSTNGVNVFASERSKYLNSFNEILGLAGNQLTTDYWFTSYDNIGMTTTLVIGTP